MEDLFEEYLEYLRENKLRIALLAATILMTIGYVTIYFDDGEEINLDEPEKIPQVEPVKPVAKVVTSDKVKVVLGANSDEIYIYDPFKKPKQKAPAPVEVPLKPEEKILPIVVETPPVVEAPKPPEIKFNLRGTAIGEVKTALIEKIVEDKVESLFVTIGDNLNGKIIVDITAECVTLDDGEKLYME